MDYTRNTGGQPSLKGFCDHCGNITFQTIIAHVVSNFSGTPITYSLTQCTICDGVAIRDHPLDWNASLKPGDKPISQDIQFTQLCPRTATFSSVVPLRIRSLYEEAQLVRKRLPSAFVVQLRRAFEALVKDKQAQGRTLNAQIRWMIDNGQLPNVFAEMMHVARMIGNLGAHDTEQDVTEQDAEVADQFFRAIVEYLYVAPALLEKVKTASPPPNDTGLSQ